MLMFVDEEYVTLTYKTCNYYGQFNDLDSAKVNCSNNLDCGGVLDPHCDEDGNYETNWGVQKVMVHVLPKPR